MHRTTLDLAHQSPWFHHARLPHGTVYLSFPALNWGETRARRCRNRDGSTIERTTSTKTAQANYIVSLPGWHSVAVTAGQWPRTNGRALHCRRGALDLHLRYVQDATRAQHSIRAFANTFRLCAHAPRVILSSFFHSHDFRLGKLGAGQVTLSPGPGRLACSVILCESSRPTRRKSGS